MHQQAHTYWIHTAHSQETNAIGRILR
ncbi:hypothetical protein HaLaN_32977, partial [Haematococcus lacustris]